MSCMIIQYVFLKYYIYIYIQYIHVLLQATVDRSEPWHWICLKFPFRLVKFCFGGGGHMSRTRPSLPLAGPTQWPGDPFRLWKTRWWTRAVLPGVLTRWSELEVTLPCRYIYLHLRTHYIIAFFLDEFLEATHFEASTFSREKKKEKE